MLRTSEPLRGSRSLPPWLSPRSAGRGGRPLSGDAGCPLFIDGCPACTCVQTAERANFVYRPQRESAGESRLYLSLRSLCRFLFRPPPLPASHLKRCERTRRGSDVGRRTCTAASRERRRPGASAAAVASSLSPVVIPVHAPRRPQEIASLHSLGIFSFGQV